MSNLDKLIEAVEVGLPSPTNWRNFAALDGDDADGTPFSILAHRSYHGSLDAVLRLHEALLPGHTRAVDATAPEMGIRVDVWSPEGPITGTGDNALEARAWLLAILRALKAQQP